MGLTFIDITSEEYFAVLYTAPLSVCGSAADIIVWTFRQFRDQHGVDAALIFGPLPVEQQREFYEWCEEFGIETNQRELSTRCGIVDK